MNMVKTSREPRIVRHEDMKLIGIPCISLQWYFRTTLPPRTSVAAPDPDGDFEAASSAVQAYLRENGLTEDAGDRNYAISERYDYNGEAFARYSLPLSDAPGGRP
ncbi:hypothetical protein SAMN02799624_04374 [Paenibacillus sp. UNC496MF]|uniref:hypothetical protein n=1 Tax=Paenibacillus sp. UNC496MF TaxID=1502753 RepID=UPI0008EB4F5D|nr:hypothetical protein [Paenibacillus sp. UNC496MF]SFJ41268.1 hypothetical protein SAMN02799624_04374 [Paenibacillus sp. UNC496MF]